MNDIAVIIPAKNEAANIAAVIHSINADLPDADVIIVDDNSSDATGDEALLCDRTIVLHSPISVGIGGAVQLGIRYGLERGYRLFVRMDGDGQHPSRSLRDMIRQAGPGRLVQGSRDPARFSASSTGIRKIGSSYFRFLFRLFTGRSIPDPTSGFMCFDRDVAKKFAEFYPLDYPEIESLVLLARSGHRIVPVIVEMQARASGLSSIGLFRGGVYMLAVTIAFFGSFIRKNPYGAVHAA